MSQVLQWTQFAALIFNFGAPFSVDHFVDGRGTEILAGIAVFADAAVAANVRLEDDQVARLVFVVARAGMIDIGQPVERELAIAFETRGLIDQRAVAIELLVFLVARLACASDPPARARR